jgi:hypothetical protein
MSELGPIEGDLPQPQATQDSQVTEVFQEPPELPGDDVAHLKGPMKAYLPIGELEPHPTSFSGAAYETGKAIGNAVSDELKTDRPEGMAAWPAGTSRWLMSEMLTEARFGSQQEAVEAAVGASSFFGSPGDVVRDVNSGNVIVCPAKDGFGAPVLIVTPEAMVVPGITAEYRSAWQAPEGKTVLGHIRLV